MSLSPTVVIGGGGHAREVVRLIKAINDRQVVFELLGYVSDGHWDEALLAEVGVERLGAVNMVSEMDVGVVLAVGDGAARQRIVESLSTGRCQPVDVIHPHAVLGSGVTWGAGLIVFPGVVVTADVRLGRHVHLNAGVTISHDCVLGDFVTVSPGCHLAGKVHVGDLATFGVASSAAPGADVGAGATVGAGAVVIESIAAGVTAVGVPARPISRPRDRGSGS